MLQSSIVQRQVLLNGNIPFERYDLAVKNTANLNQNAVFLRDGVGASRVYCPAHPALTLFEFLCVQFSRIPAETWQARMQDGLVLNAQGGVLSLDAPYAAGQHVFYFRHLAKETPLPYEAHVLFQDDYLVVADKPHFLPVIPSGKYLQETLLVRLKKQLKLPHLSPLHRIDRDTAGLVLFSVRPQDRGAYQALFRDGRIAKQYRAIAPFLTQLCPPFELQMHLEDAPSFMQVQVNSHLEPNSLTRIISAKQLPQHPNLALYTLRPHTGKRHQLRVHLLHLGAPIVGDQIYPDLKPERDISQAGHSPLQLLAQTLSFTDPITGQARHFESQRRLIL